ncbi:hypothetical protein B5F07_15850 [Lachnoclostridium sp. An169]|uniref:response regulator transcription factor n=1 Tax=Lachnoclostridium sp. An169 TaxID=1965569 RepID=UPI000B379E00|nr:helix-turn-helix domain-containing protein [Lachnoclostridium sp. An169]OUP81888.1 hypothetical protein B5F07_15850 [Lachnoclostridium sp. An169]HJA67975.1 helix-turn-helix domain-containing protein [Candidatus Mediterraneibacter cottocaccae]
MKLLIVDDEPIAIAGIQRGIDLKKLGFQEVFTAGSYTEAVDVLSKEKIDLAVCDIEMPDQSGIELMGWITENSPDTETIVLSCHDEFAYAQQAIRLHCLEYVLKPVRYEILSEVLERAVRTINEKRQQTLMTEYGQRYIDRMGEGGAESTGNAVEKVAHYIDTHLDEDLSVKALAGMVFLSADHLTRMFKKEYGKTVSDYILEKRMDLARELLRSSDLTITMVAGRIGFSSYSHFTEQFKKIYGMTPRKFQREEREKK